MDKTFTNHLVHESSPYLLQHAHNPVNWYPWGEEALERARAEHKVILVSIGYSACHWCHVMERESFENEEVAALMNAYFINIKIDREERPDLDHIYMDAVQAMAGNGGWPLNVFLTPDAKPFYGGTYYPPVKAYNRPSWTDVLEGINQAWTERASEINAQADTLMDHLAKAGDLEKLIRLPGAEVLLFNKEKTAVILENILSTADTEWGGFGAAPKFPQTFTIRYLLQYYYFTKDERALAQATLSVDKMLQGGIYDQAGGGFSRYSTDTMWLAPHFEKMLYDNALLLGVLSDLFAITKQERYKRAITGTISFVERELMHADGAFYAALDADSEGVEGKFYVWDKKEIDELLGEDAGLFCAVYDVTDKGNWEEKNILRVVRTVAEVAKEKGMNVLVAAEKLERSLGQLLKAREQRVRPGTDDKLLLGWNALMVTALCKAAAVLKNAHYRSMAQHCFDFLLREFAVAGQPGAMRHTFKEGKARFPAFLDDYAAMIQACIHLQEGSSEQKYLLEAAVLTRYVIAHFQDEASGYFFFTDVDQADIILRKKEVYDGAVPSGNSMMAENLLYLSVVLGEPLWREMGIRMLRGLEPVLTRYPGSFGVWAVQYLQEAFGRSEIVITGDGFVAARDELLTHFLPGSMLQCAAKPDPAFPLLAGKENGHETRLYLCRDLSCREPVETVAGLLLLMNEPG